MKNGKAAGPSGWVSEIVKAAEEVRVVTITGIVKGIISAEWELSSIVHCYEEKEFALERKLYGTDQILRIAEKVLEKLIRQKVDTNEV